MKQKISITILILFSGAVLNFAYGQKDNPIRILKCQSLLQKTKQPAYFVNGYFFPSSSGILSRLNPKHIKTTNIEHRDTTINGVEYYGKIFITLEQKIKKPNFIHLTDLHTIYSEIKNTPTIYTVDDKLVKDIDNRLIDKNYILDIEICKIESKTINTQVVNIITRTEENIKKRNEIRIR